MKQGDKPRLPNYVPFTGSTPTQFRFFKYWFCVFSDLNFRLCASSKRKPTPIMYMHSWWPGGIGSTKIGVCPITWTEVLRFYQILTEP